MKIKMLEYFQGSGQPYLQQGREYDRAEIGAQLCDWLLEYNKAEVTETDPVLILERDPEPDPEPEPEPKPVAKKAAPRARKPRARAKK